MSTTLSMPSPHGHHAALSHGAFASSLQLSPAFRSLHAAALRQRQHEFQRLSELARSDEFSDDESDGDEEEEEDEDDEDGEEDDGDEDEEMPEEPSVETEEAQEEAGDDALAHDSDIDADETVLLPFVRPTVAVAARGDLMSPKADDWTIVDKSPTCEGLGYGNVDASVAWFARP